jgi:hypothetical protein
VGTLLKYSCWICIGFNKENIKKLGFLAKAVREREIHNLCAKKNVPVYEIKKISR